MIIRGALLLLACLVMSACEGAPGRVVLGVQAYAEQSILAHMLRQLIEDGTNLRVDIVDCGDSYGCTQALYLKRIDLAVGYSGTGLMYSPLRTSRHRGTLAEVRKLYANTKVVWLDGLGFDSGYRLVVLRSKSRELGIVSIADLAKLEGGVRVTCDRAYLARLGDGLSSVLRRYGLRLRGEPNVIDEPVKRVMELFRRGADVAVVRQTAIPRDPGLVELRDSLRFFPRYEAAVVGRADTLASRPELTKTLARLAGRITTVQMRQLVSEVLVNGWTPAGVARRFLQGQDLLAKRVDPLGRRPVVDIAMGEGEQEPFKDLITLAVRAARHAFPTYPVNLLTSEDPVKAVAQGRARLALIAADKFFRDEGGKHFSARENRIEAAAVLGTAYLHILRRGNEDDVDDAFAGRVGVPPKGTDDARLAAAILEAAGKKPEAFETVDVLFERVEDKELDAAMVFRMPGDAWIAKQMAERRLRLRELPELSEPLPPFLQHAILPARTYPGQRAAVATEGVQVLLAGPAPVLQTGFLAGSPAAALIAQSPPLTLKEAREMQDAVAAVRQVELPHPVLPSVYLRSIAEEGLREGPTTAQATLDTGLNILVIVFVGWVIALVVRQPEHRA